MKALLLLVAGIGGLIETLVPRAVVRVWTAAMYRNAGEAEPRTWVYVAARAEGAVVVLAALVGLYRVATPNGGELVDDGGEPIDDGDERPGSDE